MKLTRFLAPLAPLAMALSLSACAVGLYAPGAQPPAPNDPVAGGVGQGGAPAAVKAKARIGTGVVGIDQVIPVRLDTPITTELSGRAIFVVTEDVKVSGDAGIIAVPADSRAVGLYVPLKFGATRLDVCIDAIVSPGGKPLARVKGNSKTACLAQVHTDLGAGLTGAVADRGPMQSPVLHILKDTPGFLVLWEDLRVE